MTRMVPIASFTPWPSKDDYLLTNSVESGASLESLAKGAVEFSRIYTLQELQDRWNSVLYNANILSKASIAMIEKERANAPSKVTGVGGCEEKEGLHAKRKPESIRSCYRAKRKRLHIEFWNSVDSRVREDTLGGASVFGDAMPDQFGPENSNLDIIMHRDFGNLMTGCVPAVDRHGTDNNFSNGLHGSVQEYLPIHFDEIQKDIPGMVGEHFPNTGNSSGIEDLSQPKEFPESIVLKTDESQVQAPSTFGRIYSASGILCSEYEETQVFSSPISDCAPFCNLEYSFITENPMCGNIDELYAGIISDDHYLGDAYADIKHTNTSECNNYFISNYQNEATCNADASTEEFMAEIFKDCDEYYSMDLDQKEVRDTSFHDGLSSVFGSYPNNDNQEPLPNTSEVEKSAVSDPHFIKPSDACDKEFANTASRIELEMHYPFMFCTLNTEDTEIPCNDDAFLPGQVPAASSYSVAQNISLEPNSLLLSSAIISGNQKMIERGPNHIQMEYNNSNPSHLSSQMAGLIISPQADQFHQAGDHALKFEFYSSDSSSFLLMGSSNAGIAVDVSNRMSPTNCRVDNSADKLKKAAEDIAERKQISHDLPAVGIPSQDPDVCKSSHGGINLERGTSSEPAVNHPTSDAEEQNIESDDDLPCFSYIETMILDMDLVPYDQDLSQSAEVLRYQQEDTMRKIIRLEQADNSDMQRSIASHGAFALLYSPHFKHYIKKPEVLLGRATENFNVDIDLGREGSVYNISRKQAIIRIDKGGFFYLENLGKCLVSVNGIGVATGGCLKLPASCLIEIREIYFIFEAHLMRVKQYLDSMSQEMRVEMGALS